MLKSSQDVLFESFRDLGSQTAFLEASNWDEDQLKKDLQYANEVINSLRHESFSTFDQIINFLKRSFANKLNPEQINIIMEMIQKDN